MNDLNKQGTHVIKQVNLMNPKKFYINKVLILTLQMGTQQSNPSAAISSKITFPQPGYRITNLDPSINSQGFKLNIMTDYVIGNDPRFLDLKKLHQNNQPLVQFDVFSILNFRIRKVLIPIQKNLIQTNNNFQTIRKQTQTVVNQQSNPSFTLNANKEFSLGINFKLYPKINDTILRISKVFKNSPLHSAQIKKDQYIVGLIEGDFTSMKSFVDLVKLLIHSQFQYITLAICNSQCITRLEKIPVKQLQKWKEAYGVGYLGVQLAQGWLNKWQLKKHIDANKKHSTSFKTQENPKMINQGAHNLYQSQSHFQQTKSSISKLENHSTQNNSHKKQQIKEQVDFSKQSFIITPEKQKSQTSFTKPKQSAILSQIPKRILDQPLQPGVVSIQNLDDLKQLKPRQTVQIPKSPSQIDEQDSNSEVSSNEIQQKFNDLEHGSYEGKRRELNVIKKSKNIVQINFKDDASTICMCKDYSKHCEKCFKQKEGNYLFFNKKTNKIILIDKTMLFPKKN